MLRWPSPVRRHPPHGEPLDLDDSGTAAAGAAAEQPAAAPLPICGGQKHWQTSITAKHGGNVTVTIKIDPPDEHEDDDDGSKKRKFQAASSSASTRTTVTVITQVAKLENIADSGSD